MIRGTFTSNDLVSAALTHLRPRRSLGIVGLILVALLCCTLWLDFTTSFHHDVPWARYALLGLPIYFVLTFGIWLPYRIRRTFGQRKDLHRECSFNATSEGLHFVSDKVQGVKPWSDYLKWREGRAVFLLYVSDGQYQAIPKRFFETGEALYAFRTLVMESIGKPTYFVSIDGNVTCRP